jgi:hypothetical protein
MSKNPCNNSSKLVDYTKFRRDDMPSRTGKPLARQVITRQPQESAVPTHRLEDESISPAQSKDLKSFTNNNNDAMISDNATIEFLFKRVSIDHRTRRRNSELSREELVMEFEKRSMYPGNNRRASSSSHHHEDLQSFQPSFSAADGTNHVDRRPWLLEGKFITIPKPTSSRRLTHIERILRKKPTSSYSMDHIRRKSWKSSEDVFRRSGSEPSLQFSGSKAA